MPANFTPTHRITADGQTIDVMLGENGQLWTAEEAAAGGQGDDLRPDDPLTVWRMTEADGLTYERVSYRIVRHVERSPFVNVKIAPIEGG